MKFEIEIKLRLPDKLEKIRRVLRDQGFRVSKSRAHESNILFDTPKRLLRSHGKLIRLRRVGVHPLLTFKGPAVAGRYKKRREIEFNLPDAGAFEQVLNEIGYHPIFRYEKFRTEYAQAANSGKVMLDETPIGNFIEIEGAPRWIDRTARLLGFPTDDYITRSYGYLYLAYCRERRIRPKDMLFTDKDLRKLRRNNRHA
ncbi:MAG: class IV adenylate cyclase [Bryobacteraceae bacterium]